MPSQTATFAAPVRRSSFAIDVPDALLARARHGERAAFEQLCRRFQRPVSTLAVRICGDREEASEVLQDTMLKMIDRISDFRGKGSRGAVLGLAAANRG